MQAVSHRLLILICAVTLLGFGACILMLHPWTDDSGTKSIIPAQSSPGSASDDSSSSRALRANPAAQKAGPPNPTMQSTAALSAENAARAAADLAAK